MSGKLYLIPTPIGNLEDITLRAIRILKEVDFILAEDTRTSGKLLQHYEIGTPLRSYHMHNEHKITESLVAELQNGRIMALITDAGTPAISDPGFLLSREAIRNDIEVETLPGATAFVPALVNSGLPAHNFAFEGFLPAKKGRKTKLEELASEKRTLIFYESPYRIVKTLEDLLHTFGEDRPASVSREISKKFEETRRGTLSELAEYFKKNSPKGEFVMCVAGKA
ncbi:MAG: 16S rRNA (cytidine(1402)-2'-O)-methyltransferase [Owenweeksia sp.]|nr:16S rRNA (cytidine(1402)-2'-O)-methyltransferase [Owenweeksia sp.]MBF99838.1 16S rRNA (cytidine(1402)-2'-O)-methyltransferase [Owenweeksia sp.]HBF21020.1 16S rRNA (cytidine(1402)-2'-O)-methyltransferase [Cryomorphaceae bacterium]|tara:strand:+ start:480 stop:1154 length:675 start_codon:yes stop_codon:yes gene_type:complete